MGGGAGGGAVVASDWCISEKLSYILEMGAPKLLKLVDCLTIDHEVMHLNPNFGTVL